ncbi:MAG: zf-HC2 domain-containing protein [Planctomycetes bacterium]|nr:zf-HC2 domain-containing protein [Planctomycetota bacterium]
MNDPIDLVFRARGLSRRPASSGADCPSDELLAGFVDAALTGADRLRVERHALGCADCHTVLAVALDLAAERVRGSSPVFRVVARLLERGLQFLNAAEHRLLPSAGGHVAALGGVRGAADGDVLALAGPGGGLDELLVQREPAGAVRLVVRGSAPTDLRPGEAASLVFEDGDAVRCKRPFTGEPQTFEVLDPGTFRVRLLARAPGGPSRELAAATVDLLAS